MKQKKKLKKKLSKLYPVYSDLRIANQQVIELERLAKSLIDNTNDTETIFRIEDIYDYTTTLALKLKGIQDYLDHRTKRIIKDFKKEA